MPSPIPADDSPASERALTGACAACGGPLAGRQRACAPKCRAVLSRQRREAARQERDRQVRALLDRAEELHQRGAELLHVARRHLEATR